jgi:hypothetical protein
LGLSAFRQGADRCWVCFISDALFALGLVSAIDTLICFGLVRGFDALDLPGFLLLEDTLRCQGLVVIQDSLRRLEFVKFYDALPYFGFVLEAEVCLSKTRSRLLSLSYQMARYCSLGLL